MPKVNLVPREEQAREFRRRIYIFPIAGAVLVVAALAGTYYYYSNQVDSSQQEYANLQSNNASLAKQLQELQQYQDLQSEKQTKLSNVENVYNQRTRWSRIMDDISFVIPNDIWLTSLTASVSGTPVSACGSAPKPNAGCTQTTPDIVLEGYTDQNAMPSVATFMIRLGLLPTLQNVNLISADTEKIGTQLAIHFRIGASLKQGGESESAVSPTAGVTPSPTMTTPTGTGTSTVPGAGSSTAGAGTTTTPAAGSTGGGVSP